jgi:hypothetical protein
MLVRAIASRYFRAFRRTFAVVLVGVVMAALTLPATTSAQIGKSVPVHLVKPLDGVADSPEVP